jgi:hypothetical protein
VAVALDDALIYGMGGDEPTGVAAVAQAGGDLIDLASAHLIANDLLAYQKSDVGARWALSNLTVGALATQPAWTGAMVPAMQGNTLAGYPAVVNIAAPSNSNQDREYLFGAWQFLHLILWDAATVVANPWGDGFKSGSIEVRVLTDANTLVRDPKRFFRGYAIALS